jgi:hypothetical protein
MHWRTDRKTLEATGIFLTAGIGDFKVGRPAPAELLEKIGPFLCAAGTEELRVIGVGDRSYLGDPARHAERGIRHVEFIRGHEGSQSAVNIRLNIETREIMMIVADFLPDRGADREPRLTAAQARAKVEAQMRKRSYIELTSGERLKVAFHDAPYEVPAKLIYEIEQFGFAPARGALVWVLAARDRVDAATGKVVRVYVPAHDP